MAACIYIDIYHVTNKHIDVWYLVVSNHETWRWGGRGGKFKSLNHKHPRYFNIIVLHSDTLFFAAMEGGGLEISIRKVCVIYIYIQLFWRYAYLYYDTWIFILSGNFKRQMQKYFYLRRVGLHVMNVDICSH